jgi:hypothetical protein
MDLSGLSKRLWAVGLGLESESVCQAVKGRANACRNYFTTPDSSSAVGQNGGFVDRPSRARPRNNLYPGPWSHKR